jgi:hypothetical protein
MLFQSTALSVSFAEMQMTKIVADFFRPANRDLPTVRVEQSSVLSLSTKLGRFARKHGSPQQ